MLSSITNTLFGNDNVWLNSEDVFAHFLDLLFFSLESLLEIIFLCELHVCHRLTLFVLKRAIKEDNTRVLDNTSHAGMGNVLIEHNTGEDFALFKETAWDLFDLGVSLNINFYVLPLLSVDSLNCLDSKVNDKITPFG